MSVSMIDTCTPISFPQCDILLTVKHTEYICVSTPECSLHISHIQQELGVMCFTVGVMSLASIGGAGRCRLAHTFPNIISKQYA